MTPFRYPKWRHTRTESPPAFGSYRKYKPHLRREFERKCVYCRLPDGLKGEEQFGVDHYRPKRWFPELRVTYSNLFYSCNKCNSYKSDWPGRAVIDAAVFIPNPCDHVMTNHLWFDHTEVMPQDESGQLAVRLLQLNDDELLLYREFVMRTIAKVLHEARQVKETLTQIDSEVGATRDPGRADELAAARRQCEADLADVRSDLVRLTGDEAVRV